MALLKKKLAPKPSTSGVPPVSKPTSVSGVRGFQVAKSETEKKNAQDEQRRNQPFRLRMAVGEERKIILLDTAKPDALFFHWEHHYENKPGVWGGFETCIRETGDCPACRALGKDGYYALMLTCLDMKPYKDKNGNTIKMSKKLLTIKAGTTLAKYERLLDKLGGSYRGAALILRRDGNKDPAIGGDVEFVKRISEKELQAYAVQMKNPDLVKPCDYKKGFPRKTEAELLKQFRQNALPGSEDSYVGGASDWAGGDDASSTWDDEGEAF